ncbi:MAG: hypothetical protein IPK18_05825 [Sphingobacteriales bacterium]|jgi:hypothetical protein|nr:MAG: hypothetical protein IPK18_05825 [Sphingobacteriales bacterium]
MKTLKKISMLLLLSISMFCISCSKDSENDTTNPDTTFNKNNYTEYLICKADGVQYAVGNNSKISVALVKFILSGNLYVNASNGEFVPGNVAPMQIELQFKSFSKTVAKNYDIPTNYPTLILKLNGTDDHYTTDNGKSTVQTNALRVTKIEDGYMYGTFDFTAYDETDKTKSIKVTDGEFKVKIPD